jgi:hypothetical protein
MAYTLQQLSDIEEIKLVKHRYFRGIDTADMALLDPLFTDDVEVEYIGGDYRVALSGRANMIEFLANSFHSGAQAMHHGHMPEITFTGAHSAEAIWQLEDIFIDHEKLEHTYGSAIYHDVMQREDGRWKIARTVYDRVMEVVQPLTPGARYTVRRLAETGLKPEERRDISHLITWETLE